MNSRHTILLVEDEPDAVILMQKALHAAGVPNPIQVVNDGEKAIAYLDGEAPFDDRSQYPLPGLLLLDLKLPRKSGFEVMDWIARKPELQTLLIVTLTSSKENKDVIRAYECGANSYLVKPASFLTLVEMMKAFREYWIRFNEMPDVPSSGS